MNRVEIAIEIYKAIIDRLYNYYWNDVEDCSYKRKAYIRLKTYGIVEHDRVLNSKVNKCTLPL